MSLEQLVDRECTLVGTARNASAGAVVIIDEGTPVYLDGMDEWDRDADGKQVSAKGTLRKHCQPDPLVNAQGEHVHGIPGVQFVLEKPSWTLS